MKNYSELSLQKYLNELSSDAPIPGGGSVSAYAAALALGLMQMVARITLKRKVKPDLSPADLKQEEESRTALKKIVDQAELVKSQAMQTVSADPQVYDEVMSGYAKKLSDAEMDELLLKAFHMQADLAQKIASAIDLNGKLAGLVKGAIKNDLIVSQHLLRAAFQGAYHTAHINLVYMKDAAKKAAAEKELEEASRNFGVTGVVR
jgi:formiminotetrahydrofolate cyclodeaminase